MMKVSIITVSLNSENTIAQTIESILSQTYNNIEYIIIDGNSSDGTVEIIKTYRNKISKFISEPDNGIYDAMNKGIAQATGDIVGILNSDDFYVNNAALCRLVSIWIIVGQILLTLYKRQKERPRSEFVTFFLIDIVRLNGDQSLCCRISFQGKSASPSTIKFGFSNVSRSL